MGALEAGIDFLRPMAEFVGIKMPESLGSWKVAQEEATAAVVAAEPAVAALETGTTAAAAATTVLAVKTEELIDPLQSAADLVKELTDAQRANEAQSMASAKAMDEFVTSIDSILTPAPVAIDVEFPSAGKAQGGLDMVMGLMKPPASVEAVLRPSLGQDMLGGLKSTFSPGNVGGTLARAFEGGGGLLGAVKSLGAQAGGMLMGKIQGALSAAGPWGALAAAALPLAIGLGKKIWGGITSMFGGPSDEVKQARGDLAAFAGEVEGYVGQTESSTARMQDFLDAGWERNRATIITYFQDQALASGRSLADAERQWLDYQAAVETGNVSLASDLAQQAMDWAAKNTEDADLAAATWAESYTAQTVTSTVATDEAVANSTRLKDAMVLHAGEILAAWTAMTDGLAAQMAAAAAAINASLASIQDKTVTITTVYRTIHQGGGGGGGGGGGSPGGGSPIVINNRVSVSRRDVTTAVVEDAFRVVRRRGWGLMAESIFDDAVSPGTPVEFWRADVEPGGGAVQILGSDADRRAAQQLPTDWLAAGAGGWIGRLRIREDEIQLRIGMSDTDTSQTAGPDFTAAALADLGLAVELDGATAYSWAFSDFTGDTSEPYDWTAPVTAAQETALRAATGLRIIILDRTLPEVDWPNLEFVAAVAPGPLRDLRVSVGGRDYSNHIERGWHIIRRTGVRSEATFRIVALPGEIVMPRNGEVVIATASATTGVTLFGGYLDEPEIDSYTGVVGLYEINLQSIGFRARAGRHPADAGPGH